MVAHRTRKISVGTQSATSHGLARLRGLPAERTDGNEVWFGQLAHRSSARRPIARPAVSWRR
jgi:hypothetical protein